MAQKMNRIHLKRVKRKKMIERRIKCHKTTDRCVKGHLKHTVVKKVSFVHRAVKRQTEKNKKTQWYKRLFTRQKTA